MEMHLWMYNYEERIIACKRNELKIFRYERSIDILIMKCIDSMNSQWANKPQFNSNESFEMCALKYAEP